MSVQFIVEMPELKRKINFVRNGLGSTKADLPTMLLKFDVMGEKVVVFAANREMFCRTEMKVNRPSEGAAGLDNGVFSLLGEKMEKLIAQVEAEQVTVIFEGESVEVQAGFLTVNFETYDGAPVKAVEQGTSKHLTESGLAVDRSALEEALSCAKACTTMNSIRPDVTHVEMRDGRMLSSDGRKIMVYSHDGFPSEMKLKCPSSTLNSVISAVKNMSCEAVEVFESGSHFIVKGGQNEFSLGVRRVERDFPAVEGQIAKAEKPTDEIAIDKHVLEAMLRGVSLGLPSDEVKVQLEVGGEGQEQYLEVSAQNSLGKRSHERASCGRKAKENMTFPLSFKHLLDTLGVFKGDSVVDMLVMTNKNLLMVRDTTEAREVLTVIPFRTDRQIEDEKAEVVAKKELKEAAQKEAVKEGEELVGSAVGGDTTLEGTDDDIDLDD